MIQTDKCNGGDSVGTMVSNLTEVGKHFVDLCLKQLRILTLLIVLESFLIVMSMLYAGCFAHGVVLVSFSRANIVVIDITALQQQEPASSTIIQGVPRVKVHTSGVIVKKKKEQKIIK